MESMKALKEAVVIFNYFDYRDYLRDIYDYLKGRRYGYSYRAFSHEAGISSHNFLPRIIRRERNLSEEFIPVLTRYLKLSEKENKYFETLVSFNNSKKPSIKEKYLKQLLALRVVNEEYRIEDKKLRFFEKWYYPVIRELVAVCDFKEDYNMLARHCSPRITPVQAKGAVAFLVKNGFIKKGSDGRYSVTEAIIATEPEVDSAIIPKYHRITIQQCADAVDTLKKEDRNFSSSTLRVSKEVYDEIKKEIYHFRKRLLSMAKECTNPEMVCFTGFQLLPRSEVIPAEREKVLRLKP
jgi:uncharacterized protein (TIGR02147 family)